MYLNNDIFIIILYIIYIHIYRKLIQFHNEFVSQTIS